MSKLGKTKADKFIDKVNSPLVTRIIIYQFILWNIAKICRRKVICGLFQIPSLISISWKPHQKRTLHSMEKLVTMLLAVRAF
jgi:hypothetical protein